MAARSLTEGGSGVGFTGQPQVGLRWDGSLVVVDRLASCYYHFTTPASSHNSTEAALSHPRHLATERKYIHVSWMSVFGHFQPLFIAT